MGRKLGQHFLFDPAILDRIVDALAPEPDDRVVEIGAGMGTLTRRLAERVGSVVAIERDGAIVARWEWEAPPNCRVVVGDALAIDWAETVGGPSAVGSFKVVGNIPYAITTPLIDKALAHTPAHVIVFLVQREVGDRLGAAPGTKAYGALTVGVRAAATVERLFVVRPGSFRPPPRVHSVVVRITPRHDPLVPEADRRGFRRFVTELFGQRRKQLARALRHTQNATPEVVHQILVSVDLDPVARPEVLTPHEFVALYRARPR